MQGLGKIDRWGIEKWPVSIDVEKFSAEFDGCSLKAEGENGVRI